MMTAVLFVVFVAKDFDKHQKICLVGSKRQAETDPQCSTSLARHSKPNSVDKTKESLPSKTEMGLQMLYPRNSLSSESPQQKTSKGVLNFAFVVGKTLTTMKTHQKGKCRVSNQHSQDYFSSDTKKRNQENTVLSSGFRSGPNNHRCTCQPAGDAAL